VRLLASALLALAPLCAGAEIEKHAYLTESGIKFFWWPKLKPPSGWVHEEEQSVEMQSNVLVPKGKTFANAETVMYARAFYEPDKKERGTLQELIDGDVKQFKEHMPKVVVKELDSPLVLASGKRLRTFSFVNGHEAFERVSYGAEGKYWVEFVISSKSARGLEKTLPAFRAMMAKYR